jgi:hypothetical protein
MAVPDFQAYAAPNVLQTGLGAIAGMQQLGAQRQQMAAQREQMTAQQQLMQQRQQQMQQQAALEPLQLQQAREATREQPQAFAAQQKTQQLHQQFLGHQIAASRVTAEQNLQNVAITEAANIFYLQGREQENAYNSYKKRMISLGVDPNEIPATLKDAKDFLFNSAQNTPVAQDERKFQHQMNLVALANKGKIDIQTYKNMGGQVPPGAQLIGGSYVYGMRGQQEAQAPGQVPAQPPSTLQPPAQQIPLAPGQPPTGAMPLAAPQPQAEGVLATTRMPQQPIQPQLQPLGQVGAIPGGTPTVQPVIPAAAAPQVAPFRIAPTPIAETAYEKQSAKDFATALGKTATDIPKIQQGIQDIDTFMNVAARIPTGTGPWRGHLAWASSEGQQAIKSQNRLALNLLSQQKFGRVTNKEMSIVQKGTLNVLMDPEAWRTLGPQLRVTAQRNMAYNNFLNDCANVGIRNLPQATKIWNKFINENPIINADGTVNPKNAGAYQKYLTPQMLRGELETAAYVPKGFKYPGE